MQKKYTIYMHTFKSTNNSYIGYTSLTMEKRLQKHILNCFSGGDSKFYRSIKKYGLNDIESKVLCTCDTKEEARKKEIEMIEKYNTFFNGLNQTIGGDGGWVVPIEKLEKWKEEKSRRMSGEGNPTYSGIKDYEILEKAYQYYLDNNCLPCRKWQNFSSINYNFPKFYSKFRFKEYGSGLKGFKNAMKKIYHLNDNNFKYVVTEDHKKNLSDRNKGKVLFININTNEKKYFFEKDIDRKEWLTLEEHKGLKNAN